MPRGRFGKRSTKFNNFSQPDHKSRRFQIPPPILRPLPPMDPTFTPTVKSVVSRDDGLTCQVMSVYKNGDLELRTMFTDRPEQFRSHPKLVHRSQFDLR